MSGWLYTAKLPESFEYNEVEIKKFIKDNAFVNDVDSDEQYWIDWWERPVNEVVEEMMYDNSSTGDNDLIKRSVIGIFVGYLESKGINVKSKRIGGWDPILTVS